MNVINSNDYVKDELSKMKTYLKNNTEDYYGNESLDWVESLSNIDGKKLYTDLFILNHRLHGTLKWHTPILKRRRLT